MEVETDIYEDIDKCYAGDENILQLRKPVTLVVLDIYKAYDNVNLDIIDPYIPEEVRDEWINEKRDLQTINMNVNGEVIKPTKGILQGSELAPFIFNFLTTIILNDPLFKKEIEPYWKFTIYADNWTIWTTEPRKNTDYRLYKLKEILNKYGLTFLDNEVKIHSFKYLSEIEPTNIKHKGNKFTRILGAGFRQSGKTLTLDPSYSTFEMNKIKSTSPNNAIYIAHKYYTPKYRYYYELFKIWSQNTANWYKNWYENRLYTWYKQVAIIYKCPKELIQNTIEGNEDIRTNYYWYYAGNFNHRFKHDNIKIQYYLNRWKSLAKWIITHKSHIGIHTLIGFIKDELRRSTNVYIRDEQNHNPKALRRTYENMDGLYFTIITKRNPDAYMHYHQQLINTVQAYGMFKTS